MFSKIAASAADAELRDQVARHALAADDLHQLLRGWGRLSPEVALRVAPILLPVHAAAAHDPELAILAREFDDNRRS
ncbi:MAG: hypothetical protein DLM57_15735 [Pseudonocardiales bacterium]|nr:MAG: hypothetical protein DLM57_15735 [Pseudonocardiales bacterium]